MRHACGSAFGHFGGIWSCQLPTLSHCLPHCSFIRAGKIGLNAGVIDWRSFSVNWYWDFSLIASKNQEPMARCMTLGVGEIILLLEILQKLF